METQDQNEPVQDDAVKKALASGRNANDNFQEDTEDDYGIDGSDADQQLEERDAIKGGKGQHGAIRNRNDDFDTESE